MDVYIQSQSNDTYHMIYGQVSIRTLYTRAIVEIVLNSVSHVYKCWNNQTFYHYKTAILQSFFLSYCLGSVGFSAMQGIYHLFCMIRHIFFTIYPPPTLAHRKYLKLCQTLCHQCINNECTMASHVLYQKHFCILFVSIAHTHDMQYMCKKRCSQCSLLSVYFYKKNNKYLCFIGNKFAHIQVWLK